MKVHYINILLFALPLNILVHNQRNHNGTTEPHTQTNRSLCECELYAPVNYDKDQEMKEVMDNFNKQTQQRFHEYDERMKEKRMQCKEKCDKESQKIILKDKLEKQMAQQLTTLDTNITTENIPTCICEKSLAEKTEKFCLNCGKNMGAIAPWWGFVNGLVYAGWINAATATAIELATKKGIEAGIQAVIAKIKEISFFDMLPKVELSNFITKSNYNIASGIFEGVTKALNSTAEQYPSYSSTIDQARLALPTAAKNFGEYVASGQSAAAEKTAEMIPRYTIQEMNKVTSTGAILSDPILLSFIAIVIVVTILLIIYLILRYRRKKKMKKKLQYIKLLEE
ncbi:rifin [Plasmodium reichenowi]|uniref:Rifin n=1 Tax=Plasmodium reichenowi TaxID=5854 RepID=A0A060RM84_PLARE|nr:rifin [Plasmodium reichenowi]